jgi:DNA end-binding protein Ku
MEKGYVLLRETLKKTGRIGIGKVVIRTRQYLCALLPQQEALLLNLMRFPQELVPTSDFKLPAGKTADYRITPRELEMAGQLIESMTADWKPSAFRDDYREKLHKFVARRVSKAGGTKVQEADSAEPAKRTSNVVDFVALLQKSLAAKGGKPAARSGTRRSATRRRAG